MDIKAYIESGIIESYVLGLATPQEADELQRLSQTYPEIAAAVAGGEQWLRETADHYALPAPEELKTQLLARLEHEFQPEKQAPDLRYYRRDLFKYAAAVLLLLLTVSGLLNVYLYNNYRNASRDFVRLQSGIDMMAADNKAFQAKLAVLEQDLRFITAPGTIKVPLAGVSGREDYFATLYWNTQTKNVYLTANHLPAPAPGKQYQLWAIVDGKPVSAGLLNPNCTDLCMVTPVQQAQAFAITLEKTGGNPTPTSDQMVVLGKVKA
ncbi:Anti-sigma-K factor RskA [Chitinophaga eiseniae]|uniref:Anti-sigma-K factor RskA n=1 Tax=Chitinophaga eiseniae TaxID=634771 RepID=A0A1T4U508_9BACT|nr:anti-sigma factor [Chitinophaga eiseniae]SKA47773.1 Anti-sigma-K factor RskA [Chitinophaga eiseniae]